MWGPWMSANFGIHRRDILEDDISLEEVISMWDAIKNSG
jgi:hypothetical protein